jgi:hypothetical protein
MGQTEGDTTSQIKKYEIPVPMRPRLQLTYQLPAEVAEELEGVIELEHSCDSSAFNYYRSISELPPGVGSDLEDSLRYETALALGLMHLHRDYMFPFPPPGTCPLPTRYPPLEIQNIMTDIHYYLKQAQSPYLAADCGPEARAFLMLQMADAAYCFSHNPQSLEIGNPKSFQYAERVYQGIVESYPGTYAARIAEISSLWCRLQDREFEQVQEGFERLHRTSTDGNIRITSAYGLGILHYFTKNHKEATDWFFDETALAKEYGLTPDRLAADTDPELAYSPLADTMIDRSLKRLADSYVGLNKQKYRRRAYAIFQHIADEYPDRKSAATSLETMANYHLTRGEMDQAKAVLALIEERFLEDPGSYYYDSYCFILQDFYHHYNKIDADSAQPYAHELKEVFDVSDRFFSTDSNLPMPTSTD